MLFYANIDQFLHFEIVFDVVRLTGAFTAWALNCVIFDQFVDTFSAKRVKTSQDFRLQHHTKTDTTVSLFVQISLHIENKMVVVSPNTFFSSSSLFVRQWQTCYGWLGYISLLVLAMADFVVVVAMQNYCFVNNAGLLS